MIKVKIDMTGWKMWKHGVPDSRLTVLKQVEDYIKPSGKHEAQWLCECNCSQHQTIVTLGTSLRKGLTKSCGCLPKEKQWESHKKYNVYEQKGNIVIGKTSNTQREFYVDVKNYELIKDICWLETVEDGFSRLKGKDPTSKKLLTMHVFLGFKNYDHIDRNEFNNLESNLRLATYTDNARNSSISKSNTSGFIGVSWIPKSQKWRASIMVNYKNIYLGTYTHKEDAIKSRLQAELKYFGPDFAPQRHLFEKYNIN